MSWLIVILLIILSLTLVFITRVLCSKIFNNSAESDKEKLINNTKDMLNVLREALSEKEELASKLQLHTVAVQYDDVIVQLNEEKEKLAAVDNELSVVKKMMEEKEIFQQELKSSKEEDEKELNILLEGYEKTSNESRELEKVLAEQIKKIDDYSKNQNIENIQRDFFCALNETLEESGGNLRAIITEYEQMIERLGSLKQQLLDLEKEYATLVEGKLSAKEK